MWEVQLRKAVEIRFHLDDNVNPAVAVGLRLRGIDVTTTEDASLQGGSDEEQLVYAARHHRIAVSHDDDFLRLAATGVRHVGIVYCHQDKLSIGQLVNALTDVWRLRNAGEMRAAVIYL